MVSYKREERRGIGEEGGEGKRLEMERRGRKERGNGGGNEGKGRRGSKGERNREWARRQH
jgi:hypothetical protein